MTQLHDAETAQEQLDGVVGAAAWYGSGLKQETTAL